MPAVFILIYSLLWQCIHKGQSADSKPQLNEHHSNGVNTTMEILSCESIRVSYEAMSDRLQNSSTRSAGDLSCESIHAIYEELAGKRTFLPDSGAKPRIIGGQEAQAHSWPWQVVLQFISMPACGGTILTPQWVISARHCFLRYSNAELWRVIAGKHDLEKKDEACQQVSKISKIFPHKGYNRKTKVNDVALLKLDKPLSFTECVRPITIVTESLETPRNCTVTGWGSTNEYGPHVDKLQEVNVTMLNHRTCNKIYNGRVTENMMCAGDLEGGIDACQGDSGSPLSCYCGDRYKLAGVVSWGVGCGRAKRPGIYTNLQRYIPWIKSIIKDDLSPVPDEPRDRTTDICGEGEVRPCRLSPGFAEVWQAEGGPRVEGVSEACPHSWPWQVSLQAGRGHCCSGTLIHRQWVLAPSSCNCSKNFIGFEAPWSDFNEQRAQLDTAVLGAHRLWLLTSHPFKVKEIYTSHTHREGSPPSDDLMLIQIEDTVPLGRTIWPVCLPDEDSELDNSWSCVTTGWEMGKFITVSPNILHQARLQLVNESLCKRRWGDDFMNRIHYCVDPAGSMACMGNSGGPLLCQKHGVYYLFGLMTWPGSQCNASSPAVFTRVSPFQSWIKNITGKG